MAFGWLRSVPDLAIGISPSGNSLPWCAHSCCSHAWHGRGPLSALLWGGCGPVWLGLARSNLAQHGQSALSDVVSGPIRDASPTVPEGMPVAKSIRHQTR